MGLLESERGLMSRQIFGNSATPGGMHCRLAGRPTVASARPWWALPSTNQFVMFVSLSCLVLDSNDTRILAKTVQVTNILSKKIASKKKKSQQQRKKHNKKYKRWLEKVAVTPSDRYSIKTVIFI